MDDAVIFSPPVASLIRAVQFGDLGMFGTKIQKVSNI